MRRTHSQGHHNKQARPAAKPAHPRETDYTNTTGHGVGAKSAKLMGAGKGRTRPYLEGNALNAGYRRPPCMDDVASYRSWLCDRQACRDGNCEAWCDTMRQERRQAALDFARMLKDL